MKKLFAGLLALTMLATMMVGCSSSETESADDDSVNIAVVFATGGLGDKSFNDSVYTGVTRAAEELGVNVQYVEPSEVAEFEGHQREFARSGDYDLIVGVGFDQMDAMSVVADEFPEQNFLLIDSELIMDNVSSVTFKDNEKGFLIGALAAAESTTGKIGFVGGMDIPLINAFAAGYMAGAAYVDPDVDVSIKYVGSWADVNTAKMLTISLYDEGADFVWAAAGGSGLGVFEAAKETGLYCIGADVNQIHEAPDNMLFSALRRLDNVVYSEIESVIDGTFTAGGKVLGLAEGAVDYATEGATVACDDASIEAAEAAREAIISGEVVAPSTLEEAQAYIDSLN